MSTLHNEILFESCKHKYIINQEWQSFNKEDTIYISNRVRWSSCKFCNSINKLKTVERRTYGTKYFICDIADIVPNQYLEYAKLLLTNLYKGNNNRRWKKLMYNFSKNIEYQDIMDTINALNEYGILIKQEKKNKCRQSNYWEITRVFYNAKYIEEIKAFIGISEEHEFDWMLNPFPELPYEPQTEQGEFLKKILLVQKRQYNSVGYSTIIDLNDTEIVSSSRAKKGYFKLISILYGLYENVENDYKFYWKTFSQKIFHDTKEICQTDKKRIEQLLGKDLTKYGIITDRDEILISGKFTWMLNKYQLNSLAYKTYIPIPRDMVAEIEIVRWKASNLLIVENQDLFFSIISRGNLDKNNWSILYGGGYISSEEIYLIEKACAYKLETVYVWTDLDPYGYQIAFDIANKLRNLNVNVNLFGFNKNWFEKSNIYKNLEPLDYKIVNDLLKNNNLPCSVKEVLNIMKYTNKKVEQEILIEYLEMNSLSHYLREDSIVIIV